MSDVVVLVYGDSLSLPRALAGLSAFETYPELLRETLASRAPGGRVALFNRSRGGATIEDLYGGYVADSVYFGRGGKHVLIIQCGIVDCAPRPVPPKVRDGIARLPTPLRWAVARALHHLRPAMLGAGLAWRNTEERAFARVLGEWIARAAKIVDAVYVINIAPTTSATNAHSPGLAASITVYNATIAKVVAASGSPRVRLVDLHGAISRIDPGDCMDADGHHITAAGHRLYAALLGDAITADASVVKAVQ